MLGQRSQELNLSSATGSGAWPLLELVFLACDACPEIFFHIDMITHIDWFAACTLFIAVGIMDTSEMCATVPILVH
ncbi:hypothetical protein AK812_SmicGene642 [Symbiodinium microadriaticum]|uniref:Uncharacterized protein n=1 Tax=Symbiodinium microadriaticum TaxID=2951 RepID=A0A1Q9F667_SYMMI|nr:hypothetical protein AK812_SmicGene642 [Symbiodinium microadriaticum]